MQQTWLVVLLSGSFLGPSGDEIDSSLDAIQFDSSEKAAGVSRRYVGSRVIPAREITIDYGSQALKPNPVEIWN